MITIFFLTPLILSFITLYSLMKRETIKWDLSRGNRCWNCKEKKEPTWNIKSGEVNMNLSLCEQCERHVKLSKLISFRYTIYFSLKKLIISSKSRSIIISLLLLNVIALCFSFWFPFFYPQLKTTGLVITAITSHFFHLFLYLELKFTSIKKPSTK